MPTHSVDSISSTWPSRRKQYLIKNASPDDWIFESIKPAIAEALDRIAATGVAMEINTSGLNKALPEMNPGPEMLAMMAEREIPIVIGSDSHTPRRVAENFLLALDELSDAGYENVSVFRERKRSDIPIQTVRESLEPFRQLQAAFDLPDFAR